MKPSIRLPIMILAFFGRATSLFAWGPGHDDVNRIALDQLPEGIAALLSAEHRKAFVEESHAPDDFTPWEEYEEKKGRTIDPKDLATLAAHDLKTPYSLHSAKGQAINFILLHEALKDRDGNRIAFWGACLAHTLADEAACNHDPLIHYLNYAFTNGYGMKLGEAGLLDFGHLCRTPEGMALAVKTLAEDSPQRLGEEPEEVLGEIMMHGLKANQFMTERGVRIASAFDLELTDDVLADSRVALAELGAYGARTWLEAITTAWALIKEGKPDPVITPELLADYQVRHADYVAARPLEADALYAPWLKLQAEANVPAVGVVVEPSVSMNKGGLSFGGRFLAPAIFRELHNSKIPFRVIDAREPGGSLDVGGTPAVIVCSGGFHNGELVRALKTYTDAGGNLLLIGGEHRDLLGPLSQTLTKAEPGTLPVTSGYGQNNLEVIDKISVRFCGPLAEGIGGEAYRFLHNPDTKAGWQKPKCAYRLKEEFGAEIEPLAKTELDGRSQFVAAVCRLDGTARFVFLPEYLIAPYLLTDDPEFSSPARPQLDRIGSTVLSTALQLLH
ncbi:MAG: hypothetical protein P1U87_06985 [Verrucomicrobiales bacterium]|nr:hypothetical protein [Verrucomicrobiales bacterium]